MHSPMNVKKKKKNLLSKYSCLLTYYDCIQKGSVTHNTFYYKGIPAVDYGKQ